MRQVIIYLLMLFWLLLPCAAQNTPWWELYGGFQFARYETGQLQTVMGSVASATGFSSPEVSSHTNMIGWNFSAQENLNSWFGGVIDFSGGYGSRSVTLRQTGGTQRVSTFNPALFTMGGGPQFAYRRADRVQPFVRMIIAAAYTNLNPDQNTTSILSGTSPSSATSDTGLALMFGGGVDYRMKSYSSFRLAADYVHTFTFNESNNNVRVSAGINFCIGKK